MPTKNIFLFVLSVVLAGMTVLTGCGTDQSEKILVVSVEPQRALLSEIVGERFEVVTMLTPGANPETFEPGMSARRYLDNAAAFFATGLLPFEHNLKGVLNPNTRYVDTSAGIVPVYGTHHHGGGTHGHGDDSHDSDPHVWASVRNARTIAKNMYETVIAIDPEGKNYYTERYTALDNRLDSLDKVLTERLGPDKLDSRAFAIWHPSLSYFARDYDLEQIAVGAENKDMAAQTLRRIIDEAREDGVKVFFFQKEYDSRQAETLNKEMGTTMVTINLLDYDWERQLDNISKAIVR